MSRNMKQVFALAIIAAALVAASPANDWSKPCFDGECAYDLPAHSGSGSLKIFGSEKSITDITPAAGWVILDCDRNALAQDIRLVCNGEDAGCNHLFDHDGPVHKLVRLPESCGGTPFARVAAASVSENQSVPSHVVRRDGSAPQVHTLKLDTNFAAIDSAKVGNVEFAVVAANFPGVNHPSGLSRRALDDTKKDDKKKDGKKDDKKDDKNVQAKAEKKKAWFGEAVQSINKTVAERKTAGDEDSSFRINDKDDFPPVTLNKDEVLFSITKQCPADSFFKISAEGKTKFDIAVGVVATGSLSPPNVDNFAIFTSADIDIDGKVIIDNDIVGDYDSGFKPLVSKRSAPSVQIPGVLTVTPNYKILTAVKTDLDLQLDYEAELNYDIDDISFWYPPSVAKTFKSDTKKATVKALDTAFSVSASPDVDEDADVEFHLKPVIEVDINGFGHTAQVFIEADSEVTLDLDGSDIDKKKKQDAKPVDNKKNDKKDAQLVQRSFPPYGSAARGLAAREELDFDGCVIITTDIDINAGSSGNFFDIFDEQKFDIVEKKGTLVKKCYGDVVDKNNNGIDDADERLAAKKAKAPKKQPDPLVCPPKDVLKPVFIAKDVVKADAIFH